MKEDLKSLFGKRLHQARTMRGWALRTLSEKLDGAVSHNALAKYEHGSMMPSSEVLSHLADVLEQPMDFFFRPVRLGLKEVRFRKRAKLGATSEKAIQEQALDFFERYHEVEEILNDRRHFAGKLHSPVVSTPDDAEKAAEQVREEWELGEDPIPNVVELLEENGIKVWEAPTEDNDFNGFSAMTEAGPVIVLANWLNNNIPRKRMTAVHELGHILLPLPEEIPEKSEEAVMRRFAGALLLPKEAFISAFGGRRVGISQAELLEIKVSFGVSMWAIMVRAKQLGLINESVFERFCMRPGNKWRKEGEPGDDRYSGKESYSRFRQLVRRAAAEDRITMTKGAALMGKSLSEFRSDLVEVFA